MNKDLETVCIALDDLSTFVTGASSEERIFTEVYGWNCPAVSKSDLALIPKQLAARIRAADIDQLDSELKALVKDLPRRIQFLQASTVPYLFNGHAVNAAPAYINTLATISQQFEPLFHWQIIDSPKAIPAKIAKRLNSLIVELDEMTPDKEALKMQLNLIKDAYESAESLPTDLKALKDAHVKVTKISDDAVVILGKITPKEKEVDDVVDKIKSREAEANQLVSKCEEAYRITTTKGLAAAFEIRAGGLSNSMYIWVLGLITALIVAAKVGSRSFEAILTHLTGTNIFWGMVFMDVVIAILTIGGPVWFAWVATKQIGQRFRLAEDYAFKASVAKAYEGYRKEAARLDSAFEARLFSSALSRLEEAPLRLVEPETHGSPWHELLTSESFKNAVNTVPELKEKLIEVAKASVEKITQKDK